MDSVPKDITAEIYSSFFNLNNYADNPSQDLIITQSTMPLNLVLSGIGSDVLMEDIRRKRPRSSKKQSMASNDAVNACIIKLAASVIGSNPLAIAPV